MIRLAFFNNSEKPNLSNDKENVFDLISKTTLNNVTYCDVLDDSVCATTDYNLINEYNVTSFVIEKVDEEQIFYISINGNEYIVKNNEFINQQ